MAELSNHKFNLNSPVDIMLLRLPFVWDWVEFKGEIVFAGINYEATIKAHKPMIDIFYCATDALNYRVIKTVQFDKNKFKTLKTTKDATK